MGVGLLITPFITYYLLSPLGLQVGIRQQAGAFSGDASRGPGTLPGWGLGFRSCPGLGFIGILPPHETPTSFSFTGYTSK